MRETMWRQPADLRGLLEDEAAVESVAAVLEGRRVALVGTGTSWHAANHGVWLLRAAGVDAIAHQGMDVALWPEHIADDDTVLLLSHRNTKRYTSAALADWKKRGIDVRVVSGVGSPGADLQTVAPERSAAFTASHLGALMRLAQIATALGAELGDLSTVPDAVKAVLEQDGSGVEAPARLLEFAGAGPNQWTASEGALKVRETAYVATEGFSVEQLYHGPSVALGDRDGLVALDGGGPGAERVNAVANAAEACGVVVYRIQQAALGEQLSIFPLTVEVQRIALELAEALETNPDTFGFDLPGREEAWKPIGL
jgi:glucosamine--fructose-6-phosphate aminotransferase (isomerizing)